MLKLEDINLKPQIDELIYKIKTLLSQLKNVVSARNLRTILGSAAVLFGLAFAKPAEAQQFGTPLENPYGLSNVYVYGFPAVGDLDDDGDYDLLVGEMYGTFKYFENTGSATNPQFGTPQSNPFNISNAYFLASPDLVDIDGDGDLDLFVGEYYGNIQYYQNTGSATSPAFANPVQNPFNLAATTDWALIEFGDLDNDGDYDLMVTEYYGNLIYFENTGSATNPSFASPQTNPFGISLDEYALEPTLADFDHDGDLDLLVGSYDYGVNYEGAFFYLENTGSKTNPQFGTMQANPFGLSSGYYLVFPEAVDMDGDGDFDIIAGQYAYYSYQNSFIYFENTDPTTSIIEEEDVNLNIYPNPGSDYINIEMDAQINRVEIIDITGKVVRVIESDINRINISDLSTGLYSLKIQIDDSIIIRKFQKQ